MATTTFSLAGIPLFAAPDTRAAYDDGFATGASGSGGFEVPEDLELGLETWGSDHRIPQTSGGQPKIINQSAGVFPKPIKWEAEWIGSQAEARSALIMAAHQDQQVVTFTSGSRSFSVRIWEYTEKKHSQYEIRYSIELRPIADLSGNLSNATPNVSASQQLSKSGAAMGTLSGNVPMVPAA